MTDESHFRKATHRPPASDLDKQGNKTSALVIQIRGYDILITNAKLVRKMWPVAIVLMAVVLFY